MVTERAPDAVAETALRRGPRAEFPARRRGARALLAERRLVARNAVAERDGDGQGGVVALVDHVHAVALVRRALARERLEAAPAEVEARRAVRCRRRRHPHLSLRGRSERMLRGGMVVLVVLVVLPAAVQVVDDFLHAVDLFPDGDFVEQITAQVSASLLACR